MPHTESCDCPFPGMSPHLATRGTAVSPRTIRHLLMLSGSSYSLVLSSTSHPSTAATCLFLLSKSSAQWGDGRLSTVLILEELCLYFPQAKTEHRVRPLERYLSDATGGRCSLCVFDLKLIKGRQGSARQQWPPWVRSLP